MGAGGGEEWMGRWEVSDSMEGGGGDSRAIRVRIWGTLGCDRRNRAVRGIPGVARSEERRGLNVPIVAGEAWALYPRPRFFKKRSPNCCEIVD